MTKLLFGQSYYLRFDQKLWDGMQPYPPLGTLYAASYMRERNYDVALFDAMLAESEAEWGQALATEKPDYAIVYEDNFTYLSKMCLGRMRQAGERMIELAKQQGVPTIICGADATDHPEHYLQAGADYVLIGEGEETLAELLLLLESDAALDLNASLQAIAGLGYKDGEEVRQNIRRLDIKDLDALPFPAWDLVDVDRYRDAWMTHHGYFSINMVTTRGCPYHCNWCAKPIWGQRYNSRSAENVAAELAWLKQTVNPDHVWFADDIMGLKPNWWQEFAALVEQKQIRTPFKCLSRADLLLRSDDEIEALSRAGCQIVWIGAESGSQKILDAMDKGTEVGQIPAAAAKLHEHGVKVGFFLQFGYPGETREDIELTLQMVRDAMPDDIGMSVSYPLPGTKFFESVKLELGDKDHWDDSADLAMLYEGPFSTDFYRHLHTVLHKEYRSRKTLRRFPNWGVKDAREIAATAYRMATLPYARHKLDQLAATSQL